ncbi:uncharacterized protein LOC130714383 [Lotus japonicus]|uniref:uncharacterized protein LOC130714383 n=1 Tax=Lotus japonicus TaxID=34305 RepID=UPI0025906371|nr:uncharacterized protein LOC130714383 [Lotus japonicus]
MDANPSSRVSPFLTNLPSRGLFSSPVISSNPGGMRVYVCDHETSPPEDQLIKTNQQNILIRSLTLKNGSDASKKRTAEKALDSRASAKRTTPINTRQEGSNSQTPNRDFHSLTVERLRALLKAKGLSTKGKKEELITRLKEVSS